MLKLSDRSLCESIILNFFDEDADCLDYPLISVGMTAHDLQYTIE